MINDFDVQKASCRFIEARTKAKKTQEQLAAELDINPQTIKNYEKAGSTNAQNSCNSRTNAIAGMKIETLYKAAKLLNVSADYLLGLSDVKSSNLDIKNAVELTGLSESSIHKLHSFNQIDFTQYAWAIDRLVSDCQEHNIDDNNKRAYRAILDLIAYFFAYQNRGIDIIVYSNGVIRDRPNPNSIPCNAIALDDTIIENAVLAEIQHALINLKRVERENAKNSTD